MATPTSALAEKPFVVAKCGSKKNGSNKNNKAVVSFTRRRFGMIFPSSFFLLSQSNSIGNASAKEQLLLTGDYDTDTRDITKRVRELLREGKGDVELYLQKFDAYSQQYKWDHKGHTNSFASLLSLDQVVRKQYEFAGKTPWEVPPLSSNKGAMLEAYVRNSESCLIKESYGKFGEMDPETRAEWKAIECSQGLVKPVKE